MAARLLAPPKGFDILGWAVLVGIAAIYYAMDRVTRG